MNYILFGGSGFLGKEVSRLILKKENKKRINLAKTKLIFEYLKKKKPDVIINCAVKANFKTQNSNQMLKVNYLAVKEMVRYCVKYKKALIHVSGTIVHPHLQVYSIKSKLKPKNFYGKTKLLADKFILKNKDKFSYKIIRFGGIYGLKGPDHLFLNQLINKKKKYFSGNLDEIKNYIHVKDAAICLKKLIKIKKNGIYYAGGQKINFKNMIKILNDKCKLNININSAIREKKIELVKTDKIFKPKSFGYYL